MKIVAAIILIATLTAAQTNAQLTLLQDILGDPTARQQACQGLELYPAESDTSFLGEYLSASVGTVNYTYHRFGPLDDSAEYNTSTLVLIPGSAATSAIWPADLLMDLAQTREVVTFDPRGYGSVDTVSSDSYTIEDIASSLVDFFDAISLDTPDVLGWSWGGSIGLWLSAFHSDKIGSLVAVSTTSGGDGYTEGLYLAVFGDNGEDVPPASLFPDTEDGNTALCRFLAYKAIMPGPNVTQQDLANQNEVINRTLSDNTLSEALANITTPTLVLHGGEDIILSIDNAGYLIENINSSVLITSVPYGHAFLLQDESDLVPTIVDFLDYYDYQDDSDDYNDADDMDYDNGESNGYNSS